MKLVVSADFCETVAAERIRRGGHRIPTQRHHGRTLEPTSRRTTFSHLTAARLGETSPANVRRRCPPVSELWRTHENPGGHLRASSNSGYPWAPAFTQGPDVVPNHARTRSNRPRLSRAQPYRDTKRRDENPRARAPWRGSRWGLHLTWIYFLCPLSILDELLYAPGHDWIAASLARLPLLILASASKTRIGERS